MDCKSPCNEAPLDLARESLIAISYLVPENALDANSQPETFKQPVSVPGTDGDDTEKYRSELMSISELPQPEALPVAKSHEG